MKGREPLAGTDDTGAGDGVESSFRSENGYDTPSPGRSQTDRDFCELLFSHHRRETALHGVADYDGYGIRFRWRLPPPTSSFSARKQHCIPERSLGFENHEG